MYGENIIIHILSISGYRRASVAQLIKSTAFKLSVRSSNPSRDTKRLHIAHESQSGRNRGPVLFVGESLPIAIN